MEAPRNYIELERRFRRLDNRIDNEHSALNSYIAGLRDTQESLGWSDLATESLVVILGEPGSGKSWELRHQCIKSLAEGQYAFFIELERVVAGTVRGALSIADYDRFLRWKASGDFARFFLDSVDEAKLRRQSDFQTAIDRMAQELDSAIGRARIVITSRISEWRPATDHHELVTRLYRDPRRHVATGLTSGPSRQSPDERPLVLQIEPLRREQVSRLVESRRISNSDQFLAALDEHSAWDFAGRPLDVSDLLEFWCSKGRLGSLTEIVDNNVRVKLRETTQRITVGLPSEARLRVGATTLAAASILCRQQQFKIPDDDFVAPNAIDAAACLPADWQVTEINALLTRALFDGASYGHIRFHHRRVSEYLAARWIADRMADGCPIRSLEQVLFAQVDGKRVLRPSMAPVAVWLCNGDQPWNENVRSWVLEAAPEIHLEYGDGAALPSAYKRQLLHSWLARHSDRNQVWVRSSADALKRLAAPELAGDIAAKIADQHISADLRTELLRMVRHGRLTGCLPYLVRIISSATESESVKIYAVTAIRDFGPPEIRQQVWDVVQGWPEFSGHLAAAIAEVVFPEVVGPDGLLAILLKTAREQNRDHYLQWTVDELLDERLLADQSGVLLEGLNALAQSKPHIVLGNHESDISQQFEWVLDVIPTAMLKLLSSAAITDPEADTAAKSLALIADSRHFHHQFNSGVEKLDSATHKHPRVRRAYFWQSVALWRSKTSDGYPCLHTFFDFDSVLQPTVADFDWLVGDIESAGSEGDRELALRVALQLPSLEHQPGADHRLRRAIGPRRELRQIYDAYRREARWRWLRRLQLWLCHSHYWAARRYRFKRAFRERWHRARTLLWLHWNIGRLRSGQATRWLALLSTEARSNHFNWAPSDWSVLAKKRGRRVAESVKAGCLCSWRTFCPQLPHEKPSANTIDDRVIVGLAGLQAMCKEGDFPAAILTEDDAQLATRYAVNELNGLPAWLAQLATVHPGPVQAVLDECVQGEWQYASDRPHAHDVIADLVYADARLANLVRSKLHSLLASADPQHPEVLNNSLALLLKTMDGSDDILAGIALERCRDLAVESQRFALWATTALQLDANAAITILEDRFRVPDDPKEAVTRICNLLEGTRLERIPIVANPSFRDASALRRLIPLIYRYVRPADDVNRIGEGPYTPTERDHAQEFRGKLLSLLAHNESRDAVPFLRELVTETSLSTDADWIRHLIDERVRQDQEMSAWAPKDIREFATSYEALPKTDRDLFQIVVNRLDDIKHDVEQSDNSLREEVAPHSNEYVLRRFLQRKLNERSRQRYTAPQEEEIDRQERPDIRVETPATPPVSIEVKWADNWTLSELVRALETQLVGQYLRAHNSRYGVLVIATDGRKMHWKTEDDKVTFRDVVDILQKRASELSASRQVFDRVEVLSIDFRTDPGI
jgi:hypothetical protein